MDAQVGQVLDVGVRQPIGRSRSAAAPPLSANQKTLRAGASVHQPASALVRGQEPGQRALTCFWMASSRRLEAVPLGPYQLISWSTVWSRLRPI